MSGGSGYSSSHHHTSNNLVSPTSSYERNQAWLEQHQARLANATQLEEERQLASLRSVPKIDNFSSKLAATRASVEVSTRLFNDAEKLRESRKHLTEITVATEVIGVPAITKYAAQLEREGNVSDRLYAQAKQLEEKRKANQEAHENHERSLHKLASPPPSSRSMRSGSIDHSGLNISSHSSLPGSTTHSHNNINAPRHTVEQLYRMGEEIRAKKEAAVRAAVEEAKATANPKLNQRSLEIAANMSEESLQRLYHKDIASRYPKGSKERETAESLSPNKRVSSAGPTDHPLPSSPRHNINKSPPKYVARWEEEETELTFHPKVEKRSTLLAVKKYGGSIPVEQRLFSEAEKMIVRKKELAKSIIEHELQGCTFQPNADRRALSPRTSTNQLPNGTVHKTSEDVGKRIFSEQVAWLNDRKNRLKEAKRDQEEKELNGCTFKPNVSNARRASIGGGFSTSMLNGTTTAGGGKQRRSSLSGIPSAPLPGYDKFMTRLANARKLAYEKANPPFADGSNWKPTTTRAVAPKFHGRSSTNDENSSSSNRGGNGIRGRVMAAIHTRFGGNTTTNNNGAGATNAARNAVTNESLLPSVSQIITAAVTKMVTQAGKAIPSSSSSVPVATNNGNGSTKAAVVPPTEVATADDIRNRLRQLEQNMVTSNNTPTSTTNNTTNGTNNNSSVGGLMTTVVAGVAPKGIIKGHNSTTISNKNNNHSNNLLPPDIRFTTTSGSSSSKFGSNGPTSPDPLLSRLEAMANAASK